jgi:hypothetical protein
MITQTTFFGLPLRTTHQRRAIVIGYYTFVSAFPLIAMLRGHGNIGLFLPQTLVLGGLLGGIRPGGPVKPYNGAEGRPGTLSDTTPNYPIQSLNLSGNIRPDQALTLDEREQAQRDHAHYLAYAILRWVLGATALLFILLVQMDNTWLLRWSPVLLWTLLIFTLSLPQSILLWTEPDPPGTGDLTLVPE